jgi:hypothetical protein
MSDLGLWVTGEEKAETEAETETETEEEKW